MKCPICNSKKRGVGVVTCEICGFQRVELIEISVAALSEILNIKHSDAIEQDDEHILDFERLAKLLLEQFHIYPKEAH